MITCKIKNHIRKRNRYYRKFKLISYFWKNIKHCETELYMKLGYPRTITVKKTRHNFLCGKGKFEILLENCETSAQFKQDII